MPPRKTSSGICTYCLAPIAKPSRSILDHITGCPEQKVIDENLEYSDHLIMMIEGEDPNYWMIIKTLPNNTLTRLDTFLRNIWVECCGHMSEFSYGTTSSGVLSERVRNSEIYLREMKNFSIHMIFERLRISDVNSLESDFLAQRKANSLY